MSFSAKVKSEVCRISDLTKEEAVATLSAIMKVSGTLGVTNRKISFRVVTENAAIARLVFKLLKEYFGVHTRIMVKKSNSLKKNNAYVIIITEDLNVKELLIELCILKSDHDVLSLYYSIPDSIFENENHKRAYIRGAFLGGGSISNPEKTYHLEFVTHND